VATPGIRLRQGYAGTGWLCDACVDAGVRFALGHALSMKAIKGTKTKNDKVDSKKIADLLRTNYLPAAPSQTS